MGPIPARVDLDPGVREINPHRDGRSLGRLPRQDQRAIEAAGARAERLHAAQNLGPVNLQHARGRSLPRDRVAAPHARPHPTRRDRGELAVSHLGRGLHREALDRVQVPVEDPPDRSIRARHAPDEIELGRCGRPRRSRARVPGEHPGALEQPDRPVGKARRGLAVALGGPGLDLGEHVVKPGGDRIHRGGHSTVPNSRPASIACPATSRV